MFAHSVIEKIDNSVSTLTIILDYLSSISTEYEQDKYQMIFQKERLNEAIKSLVNARDMLQYITSN